MPPDQYNEPLSDLAILGLLHEGRYRVDLEAGVVLSRHGKPLCVTRSGRTENYWYVRLYRVPHVIHAPVARVVWLAGNDYPLPDGFEIHHLDEDPSNNAFSNLVALSERDHRKMHAAAAELDEVPF